MKYFRICMSSSQELTKKRFYWDRCKCNIIKWLPSYINLLFCSFKSIDDAKEMLGTGRLQVACQEPDAGIRCSVLSSHISLYQPKSFGYSWRLLDHTLLSQMEPGSVSWDFPSVFQRSIVRQQLLVRRPAADNATFIQRYRGYSFSNQEIWRASKQARLASASEQRRVRAYPPVVVSSQPEQFELHAI